ncbi:MAG TPA: hypothetical protein VH083_21310 [Myxococcales bacterium]|jgi:hypothetical protein|nr:hypothetical protein [Myxococcales bacterium]
MKFLRPYRVAAVLLVIFCGLHTAGGMFGRKDLGFAANAVFISMQSVFFDFGGARCSWYGFWLGFGLTVSLFLLLAAVVSWQLDKVAPADFGPLEVIAWALALSMAGTAALSWMYFFAGSAILATVVAGLLVAGAIGKGFTRERRGSPQ